MQNPQLNAKGELTHLLTIEGLPRAILTHVLDTATSFVSIGEREVKKIPLMRGKSVFNLFFENSTRTRTTFEIAAKRLSADVINLNVDTSSASKGESLLDTIDNLAAMNADVSAAACFYATDIHSRTLGRGKNDDTLDGLGQIKAELLMIWGRQDPHIPREGRRLIQDAMEEAELDFSWHEVNGQHAFIRDEGHRYDPELARECMGMVLGLFHRRLRDG